MTKPVQTITSETSLKVIMENMRQSHRRALPVIDQQGKVQGLVTVFDIFNALLNSNQNPSTPD
ncbi:MAG: CBS domain-containing protein [Candidatus Aminicenantes bacterium]|nr:CBS domain-containing protein [Candidatus Aminicenantes bacterium]NIT22889.1 CBS domain-containing protein [Candidatus Aminicenantes bacterium]